MAVRASNFYTIPSICLNRHTGLVVNKKLNRHQEWLTRKGETSRDVIANGSVEIHPEFARTMEPCPSCVVDLWSCGSPNKQIQLGGADPATIILATGLNTRSCGSPKQIQLGGADPATIILVTGCKSCRSSL